MLLYKPTNQDEPTTPMSGVNLISHLKPAGLSSYYMPWKSIDALLVMIIKPSVKNRGGCTNQQLKNGGCTSRQGNKFIGPRKLQLESITWLMSFCGRWRKVKSMNGETGISFVRKLFWGYLQNLSLSVLDHRSGETLWSLTWYSAKSWRKEQGIEAHHIGSDRLLISKKMDFLDEALWNRILK